MRGRRHGPSRRARSPEPGAEEHVRDLRPARWQRRAVAGARFGRQVESNQVGRARGLGISPTSCPAPSVRRRIMGAGDVHVRSTFLLSVDVAPGRSRSQAGARLDYEVVQVGKVTTIWIQSSPVRTCRIKVNRQARSCLNRNFRNVRRGYEQTLAIKDLRLLSPRQAGQPGAGGEAQRRLPDVNLRFSPTAVTRWPP